MAQAAERGRRGRRANERPLRVCFLTEAFPPGHGGQQRHGYELCECLIARGAAVSVLTRREPPEAAVRETYGSVPVVRLPPSGNCTGKGWRAIAPVGLFLLHVLWRLLRDARRYDVVLISGFRTLPLVAALACAVTRKPCAVRPESPRELEEPLSNESSARMQLGPDSRLLRAVRSVQRLAAQRIDCFVAISAQVREALVARGIEERKIVSIPNGIDTRTFAPVDARRKLELRTALKLPADGRILVYTGRLSAAKGLLPLVSAWRELSPQHPRAHLLLVGSGEGSPDDCERELLDYVEAHGLAPSVTLTGRVEKVSEYLQASDVFVFASESEGFGLSLIEAMAVGLPVVTTRVGIAPELVQPGVNGLLFAPRSPESLARALRWALECDAATATPDLLRAHGLALGHFGMEAVGARYLELLDSLAAEARR
jgi:glycosyltransferase involved in cell wall biosynthesis